MTGDTHKAGGVLCSLIGFMLLKKYNMLLPGVNEFLQLAVIYPYATWGSVASDLDHHWESCPDKNLPNKVINVMLHATTPLYKQMKELPSSVNKNNPTYKLAKLFSASHRSWQTHSDLTLIIVLFILKSALTGIGGLGTVSSAILALVTTGVALGIIAHFILDMLNPDGIWFTFGRLCNYFLKKKVLPEKIRLVPKSSNFCTDTPWETLVRRVMKGLTVVVFIIFILSYFNPDFLQNFPFFEIDFQPV